MKMESLSLALFVPDKSLTHLISFRSGVGHLLYKTNCPCLSHHNKHLSYQNCFFSRNYDMYYFSHTGIDKHNYNNSKNQILQGCKGGIRSQRCM